MCDAGEHFHTSRSCFVVSAVLTATLTAIVKGHKQGQIDDLIPWDYPVTVLSGQSLPHGGGTRRIA
ncbi:hypothetical protein E2975_17100 [Paracoccus yeei]